MMSAHEARMLKNLNRDQVIIAIKNQQPFRSCSGTMSGEWLCGGALDPEHSGACRYVVYSYSTWIGASEKGQWELNPNRYSVTTSRHQSYLRRAIA